MNEKDIRMMFHSADMAIEDLLDYAQEAGAEVATARYHMKESRAVRLSQAFRAATKDPKLLTAFADGYKSTYQDLENAEVVKAEIQVEEPER